MSYTPTNWQLNDVITAERLNKMENGIANAGSGGSMWPYNLDPWDVAEAMAGYFESSDFDFDSVTPGNQGEFILIFNQFIPVGDGDAVLPPIITTITQLIDIDDYDYPVRVFSFIIGHYMYNFLVGFDFDAETGDSIPRVFDVTVYDLATGSAVEPPEEESPSDDPNEK